MYYIEDIEKDISVVKDKWLRLFETYQKIDDIVYVGHIRPFKDILKEEYDISFSIITKSERELHICAKGTEKSSYDFLEEVKNKILSLVL